MSALRRTASAGLTLDKALTLSQISEMVEAGGYILPPSHRIWCSGSASSTGH